MIKTNVLRAKALLCASLASAAVFAAMPMFLNQTQAATAASSVAITGCAAWSNPGNVFVSDNIRATATSTNCTAELQATDFNFDITGTVTGIQATYECRETESVAVTNEPHMSIQLLLGGSKIGNAKVYNGPMAGPTSQDTAATFPSGVNNDMWSTSLTESDVEADSFGVSLWSYYHLQMGQTDETQVDQVRITVYYTNPEGEACSQTRTGILR